MEQIKEFSELINQRNEIDHKIVKYTRRPAEKGHIAEWVASKAFPINLNERGNQSEYDGIFNSGDLKGKYVDIKYHAVNNHIMNINSKLTSEVYLLVFTGPYESAQSSKGKDRPFCISNIYLFNENELYEKLKNWVKISVATSVRKTYWEEKEIYPNNKENFDLELNREVIELFRCKNTPG